MQARYHRHSKNIVPWKVNLSGFRKLSSTILTSKKRTEFAIQKAFAPCEYMLFQVFILSFSFVNFKKISVKNKK
jgi:hypothetical protein